MTRKPLLVLFFLGVFYACTESTPVRSDVEAWNEVKSSVDFWDYAAFIQAYPTSAYFDKALLSYMHHRDKLWDSIGVPMFCCKGNCLDLRVVQGHEVLVDYEPRHVDSVPYLVFAFFENKYNDPFKPEQKQITIPETNRTGYIAKGLLEIVFDPKEQPSNALRDLVIAASKGIDTYKEYLANSWYHSNLEVLSPSKRAFLDSSLEGRLIFYEALETGSQPRPNRREDDIE
jgi:hypothetical protein